MTHDLCERAAMASISLTTKDLAVPDKFEGNDVSQCLVGIYSMHVVTALSSLCCPCFLAAFVTKF